MTKPWKATGVFWPRGGKTDVGTEYLMPELVIPSTLLLKLSILHEESVDCLPEP